MLNVPYLSLDTADRIIRGETPFAVVGLGPNPDPTRPENRWTMEQRAIALQSVLNAHKGFTVLVRGTYGGESEPGLLLYGLDWPGDVAVKAGRAIGQESVFVSIPGTAAVLRYCDTSGPYAGTWAPLGNVRPGRSADGDYTAIPLTGGGSAAFHA